MTSSSSSKRRGSAIGRTLPGQLAQLALDLLLDVERLLALARTPLVARDDQRPDLLAKACVDRLGRGRGEALELGLDVHGLLAAPSTALVAGGEQLPDLSVALGA